MWDLFILNTMIPQPLMSKKKLNVELCCYAAWLLGRYPIMLKQRDARHIMKRDLFTSEIKCYFSEEVRHDYVVYRKHKHIIKTSMGQIWRQ